MLSNAGIFANYTLVYNLHICTCLGFAQCMSIVCALCKSDRGGESIKGAGSKGVCLCQAGLTRETIHPGLCHKRGEVHIYADVQDMHVHILTHNMSQAQEQGQRVKECVSVSSRPHEENIPLALGLG